MAITQSSLLLPLGHQKALFKAIKEGGGITSFCSCRRGKRTSEDSKLEKLLMQLEDFPDKNSVEWKNYYLKAKSCLDTWWKNYRSNSYDALYTKCSVKPELSSALIQSSASNKEEKKNR